MYIQLRKRIRIALLAGCASAFAIGSASTAAAQDAPPPPEDAGTGGISDIVVTARKTSESVQKVPITITAFSAEDVITRQVDGIVDLAKSTPSLNFANNSTDSFGQYATIRGVTSTDVLLVTEPAIGIYMDGVYQGTTNGTGLNDAFDIQRVEVLKGPQGTLYGRNTVGGAIGIYTNVPDYDGWSGRVKLGLGNYDTQQGAIAINIPISQDKAALRLVGQYFDRGEGFGYDVTNKRELQKLRTRSLRATLRLDPTEQFQIMLRGDYSKGSNSGKITVLQGLQNPLPGSVALAAGLQLGLVSSPADLAIPGRIAAIRNALLDARPTGFYDTAYSAGLATFNRIEVYGGSATISYDFSEAATLKSITSYRKLKKTMPSDVDGSIAQLVSTLTASVEQKQITQEVNLTGTIADNRLKYVLGGYYYFSDGNDGSTVNALIPINPTNPAITDADVKNKSYAGYFQATYSLLDNLNITGGVRYTDESKTLVSRNRNGAGCQVPLVNRPNPGVCSGTFPSKFNNWSYTASVDFQVTPTTLLYARTSRGFKAGGQNERGTSVPGSYAAFQPELLTDYEVGFKTDLLDRRLRLNGALFTATYDDIQQTAVFADANGNPYSIVVNSGKARIRGGEIEMTAKPTPELLLRGAFSVTDAELTRGQIPTNPGNVIQGVAKYQASGSFLYTHTTDLGHIQAGANYSYRSRVDFQSANHLLNGAARGVPRSLSQQKGFGLVDARLAIRFERGDFEFALWGKNLTKEKYNVGALDLAGPGLGAVSAYRGDPRTYGIEFNKNF